MSDQITSVGKIPNNWKLVELGSIADITKLSGFEFTKHISYNDTGEIIALRALNVNDGKLDLTNVKYISEEVSNKLERSKLYKNDILLTYTGKIGDFAIIDENNKYHLAPNICRIRVGENTNLNYIYAYFRSEMFRTNLASFVVGSTQSTIPMKNIRQVKVPLPPLTEQKEIAEIILTLEKKLNLNNCINQTLELTARAIFKSWFVDFDPVKAKAEAIEKGEDPELAAMQIISGKTNQELKSLPKEVIEKLQISTSLFPKQLLVDEYGQRPNGWRIETVEELIKNNILFKPLDGNHGSIHPKAADYVDSGIPFIMASDLEDGAVNFNTCKFISEDQASTLRKGFTKEGDVLISHKATIGRTAIVGKNNFKDIVLTPQVTYYRIKDITKLNTYYLKSYFDSTFFQSTLNQWAGSGSTRAYLGITKQLKLPILIPSEQLISLYGNICRELYKTIQENLTQNTSLSSIRDTLLPKLLSGELTLPTAEAKIKEATA